jgi:hypothetical protein
MGGEDKARSRRSRSPRRPGRARARTPPTPARDDDERPARPAAPAREHAAGRAAPDERERARVPRGAAPGQGLSASGRSRAQGIHDIALLLGFEASRDLAEEAVHGVRPAPLPAPADVR